MDGFISHANATYKRWHMWEIDLRYSLASIRTGDFKNLDNPQNFLVDLQVRFLITGVPRL